MAQFSTTGQKYLKCVHLFFVCMWIGGGLSLVLLQWTAAPSGGDELYAVNASMKLIDDFIIVPGALGSLLTGLLYSLGTNWGFFRHRWVVVKWALTVAQVLFGTFALGPWLNGNEAIAKAERALALQNPVFLHNREMNSLWGTAQVALLVVMVWISVVKPWRERREG